MPAVELDAKAARRALDEVLKNPGFARNERLSHFLRFLVERHLGGRDHELKESVIGTEVFGRKPDYSPKLDPVVRTEARRLRERLRQYYDGVGANDALRIELPKGGYVPAIHRIEGRPALSAHRPEGGPPRLGKWRSVSLSWRGLDGDTGSSRFDALRAQRRAAT